MLNYKRVVVPSFCHDRSATMARMRSRLLLITLPALAALPLSGCGGSDATSPGTDGASVPAACAPMTSTQAQSLTTYELGPPANLDVAGTPACQWRGDRALVQLIAAPASLWAKNLPAAIKQFEDGGGAGDGETRRKIEKAKEILASGTPVDDATACDLFFTMAEVQNGPGRGSEVVNIAPSADNPQAVTAQTCTKGRFTSVTLADREALEKDADATSTKVRAVMVEVHRAVTGG